MICIFVYMVLVLLYYIFDCVFSTSILFWPMEQVFILLIISFIIAILYCIGWHDVLCIMVLVAVSL
jgi:hypothetical protein